MIHHSSRPLLLRMWSKDQQYWLHMGACWRCRFSGPALDLLNQRGHSRSQVGSRERHSKMSSSYNNKISFFILLSASSYLSYISILVFPLSFFLSFFFSCIINFKKGFPGGTSGKELACQCRRHKRCRFDPLVRKIPWRRAWQPTPVFLPGKSQGQRSPAGYSP